MEKPLRIGFITCHFPPDSIGGGQVQSHRLCEELGEKNNVFVYSRDYSGKLAKTSKENNYLLIRRKIINIPILRSFIDLFKMVRFIKNEKANTDVFISFHFQLSSLAVVICKILFGAKVAISPRGKVDFDYSPFYKKILQKFLVRNTDALLIQSENIKNEFLNKSKNYFSKTQLMRIEKKIKIFPNLLNMNSHGINIREKSLTKCNLIFVGRLIENKGINYLIEAVRLLGNKYVLTIIGDGPEKAHFQNLAKDLPIKYVGYVDFSKVKDYLLEADLFILPSLTENLPNVILEAFSCGLPVIATNVGAIPEVVTEGWNGYLVKPKSSTEISEKVKVIIENSEKYNELSKNALKTAQKYSPQNLLPELELRLEEIIR